MNRRTFLATSGSAIAGALTTGVPGVTDLTDYGTFAAAFADMTPGDTLYLPAGVYSTADYGRCELPSGEVYNLVGEPGYKHGTGTSRGSVIYNPEGELTTKSIVDCESGTGLFRQFIYGLTVVNADPGIWHGIIVNSRWPMLAYNTVEGVAGQGSGIALSGEAFAASVHHCHARSGGFALSLGANGASAIVTGGQYMTLDGEWSVYANTEAAAIYNAAIGGAKPNSNGVLCVNDGISVVDPYFECNGEPVRFRNGAHGCRVERPHYNGVGSSNLANFGACSSCSVTAPVVNVSGKRWYVSGNATDAVIDYGGVRPANEPDIVDAGTRTQVRADWHVDDAADRPANPHPGMEVFNRTAGEHEYHDGSAWQSS